MTVGDVVLMKDASSRKDWPMAIVTKAICSDDGLVRRVMLRLRRSNDEGFRFLERAVHDLLLLVPFSLSGGNVMADECHDLAHS